MLCVFINCTGQMRGTSKTDALPTVLKVGQQLAMSLPLADVAEPNGLLVSGQEKVLLLTRSTQIFVTSKRNGQSLVLWSKTHFNLDILWFVSLRSTCI